MKNGFRVLRAVAYALALLASGGAQAQAYPERAIRWVVPYPPGGSTDILTRIIGQKMNESWGQPVVV